jgi:hypothetical protein
MRCFQGDNFEIRSIFILQSMAYKEKNQVKDLIKDYEPPEVRYYNLFLQTFCILFYRYIRDEIPTNVIKLILVKIKLFI